MKPFETEHIREFGDGTCEMRAVKIKPGFTTGDLIDYVLEHRKNDSGAIYPSPFKPGQRAEYCNGHTINLYAIPEKPVKALTLIGGYHRWDYIFEI